MQGAEAVVGAALEVRHGGRGGGLVGGEIGAWWQEGECGGGGGWRGWKGL